MKNSKHKVSIVMPCFNSEKFIDISIKSVLNQTYQNWELIICDDNSSDSSKKIVSSYTSIDFRIKLVSNLYDKGAPGARNSCLEKCSGKYIAFLDSDDVWLPEKLENQINFMQKNNYAFSYSYYEVMNTAGKTQNKLKAPKKVNLQKMKYSNFIPCLTVIIDKTKVGFFRQPYIKKRNDFALWLNILKNNNIYAHCLPVVTAKYRSNKYGLSSNKLESLKYFYLCLVKYAGVSRIKSIFFSTAYLFLILIKKYFPNLYNMSITKI